MLGYVARPPTPSTASSKSSQRVVPTPPTTVTWDACSNADSGPHLKPPESNLEHGTLESTVYPVTRIDS